MVILKGYGTVGNLTFLLGSIGIPCYFYWEFNQFKKSSFEIVEDDEFYEIYEKMKTKINAQNNPNKLQYNYKNNNNLYHSYNNSNKNIVDKEDF